VSEKRELRREDKEEKRVKEDEREFSLIRETIQRIMHVWSERDKQTSTKDDMMTSGTSLLLLTQSANGLLLITLFYLPTRALLDVVHACQLACLLPTCTRCSFSP
jgi:hypothetical protein